MNPVVRTAGRYADFRLAQVSGGNRRMKLGGQDLRSELATAAVFGELSAMERVMAEIVSDKTLTREDIEAKLHLSIVELYNHLKPVMGGGHQHVRLEDYLSLRGYYNKDVAGAAVTSVN